MNRSPPRPTDIHAPSKINSQFSSRGKGPSRLIVRALTDRPTTTNPSSTEIRAGRRRGLMCRNKAGRFELASHARPKRGEITHQYHPPGNCGDGGRGSTGPPAAHCWICSMVLAAGGDYHAVSELPPHQCATSSGMPAKLRY